MEGVPSDSFTSVTCTGRVIALVLEQARLSWRNPISTPTRPPRGLFTKLSPSTLLR